MQPHLHREGHGIFVRCCDLSSDTAVGDFVSTIETLDRLFFEQIGGKKDDFFPNPYGGAIYLSGIDEALDAASTLAASLAASGISAATGISWGRFERTANVQDWNSAALPLNEAARLAFSKEAVGRILVTPHFRQNASQILAVDKGDLVQTSGVRIRFSEKFVCEVKGALYPYHAIEAPYRGGGTVGIRNPGTAKTGVKNIVLWDVEKYSAKDSDEQAKLSHSLALIATTALHKFSGNPEDYSPTGDGGFLLFETGLQAMAFAKELRRASEKIVIRTGINHGVVAFATRGPIGPGVLRADAISAHAPSNGIAILADAWRNLDRISRVDWQPREVAPGVLALEVRPERDSGAKPPPGRVPSNLDSEMLEPRRGPESHASTVLIYSDTAQPRQWVDTSEDGRRLLRLMQSAPDAPRIVEIRDIGGSGKSCFARSFFYQLENERADYDLKIWFSFYPLRGQVDPFAFFLDFVLEHLAPGYLADHPSAEQKRTRVADLLRKSTPFLVLDGLEVAQRDEIGSPSFGMLLNRSFSRFLHSFLNFSRGHVLITTRVPVTDLIESRGFQRFELSAWTSEDVMNYLRADDIPASDAQAALLIKTLGSHRLTIAMFRHVLKEYYQRNFEQAFRHIQFDPSLDSQTARLGVVLEDYWAHLGPHERLLMKRVSALYGEADRDAFEVLTDMDPDTAHFNALLWRLRESSLIISGGRRGQQTITAHPLIKQFCYTKMDITERRETHRLLARYFERRPKPASLKKVSDLEDFIEWFQQCLRGELFDEAYEVLQQHELRSALYFIGWYQGQLELIESLTAKALQTGQRQLAEKEQVGLIMVKGHLARKLGRPLEALKHFEAARELSAAAQLAVQEYGAAVEMAITLGFCGNYKAALDLLPKQKFEIPNYYDAPRLEWRGVCLGMVGEFAEAIDSLQQAIDLARSTQDARHLPAILTHLGDVLMLVGRLERAAQAYREARAVARARGYRDYEGDACRGLGDLRRQQNKTQQASRWFSRALAISEQLGYQFLRAETLLGIARLAQEHGTLKGFSSAAEQSLRVSAECGYKQLEAAARLALAEDGASLERSVRQTHLWEALQIAESTGSALLARHVVRAEPSMSFYGLEKRYEVLWTRNKKSWLSGGGCYAAMRNGEPVPKDYCVSTVARLSSQQDWPERNIDTVLRTIQAHAGNQFIYPAESLHVTLLGCTQRTVDRSAFTEERIRLIAEKCSEVLAKASVVRIRLRGVGIFDSQIAVQGFPEDLGWARLRTELDSRLREIGEKPISYPYALPVHLNIARLTSPVHDEVRDVINVIEKLRDADVGVITVQIIELVITDFVLTSSGTQFIERYKLGGSDNGCRST